MRIAVQQGLVLEQRAVGLHRVENERTGLLQLQAADHRRVGEEPAVAANRIHDRQAIAPADDEVVLAMRRCRVHAARTGFQRHVIAQDHRHFARLERMRQLQPFQHAALEARHFAHSRQAIAQQASGHQALGQQQAFGARLTDHLDQHVLKLCAQRDRLVRRQRPRRGRPDDDRCGYAGGIGHADAPRQVFAIDNAEGHIDRRRGFVLVFDLGLGQCRAAVQAPVHGLGALVQVTIGDDLAQRADLLRLELRIHRQVRLVPVAEHTQALEVLALDLHLFHRIGAAGGAEGTRVQLLADAAMLLLDLQFNRQSMAIPTGDIRRIHAIE